MNWRTFLIAAGIAATLGALSADAAGVKIGGGSSDRKGGGCHGIFCIPIDPTTIGKKITPPEKKTPPAKPAGTPQTVADTMVCIQKFNDVNGNGVHDWMDTPLPNFDFIVAGATSFGAAILGPTGTGGGTCFQTQFPAGTYTAAELAEPGWVATTPGGPAQTFTIVPGQNVTLIFGNHQTPVQPSGTICVTKYNDLNGNGVRDSGEPTLYAFPFTIRTASGVIVDHGITDQQGLFCTTHPIPVGMATVYEWPQQNWVNTDPGGTVPTKTVTITAGQTTNVSFGNRIPPPPQPMGQICIAKYDDVDGDGSFVSGEPMLAGWQFAITGPSGPFTLVTGPNGNVCTPVNLTLGNYVVTETMQAGWSSTSPGGALPHRNVTVAAGVNPASQMFGNVHAAPNQICVEKYQDLNKNRHFDSGEPPLSGWTFTITNASGNVVASGTTGADGRYCTFSNLSPGSYTVTETPQAGWVNTDPVGPPLWSPPWHKPVTLVAAHGTNVRFGNIKSGQLCVHKFNDVNGNGVQDIGEPPLSGWTFVEGYLSGGTSSQVSVTTGNAGTGCIDLPPGPNQKAQEIPQAGWTSTAPLPVNGHVFRTYTIVEGQTTDVTFANIQTNPQPGRVCITKYNDTKHNGIFDPGEWLLTGWHFKIKTGAGVQIATVVSSATSPACMDLPVGSYVASEVMQNGWTNSDPSGPNPQKPFTIGNGQTVNLSFGNYQIPLP
jgi:hypothetical protein